MPRPGKVVTVEIIEQPTRHSQPIGKVAEVLGELDDPGMEIEIAVRKFDVPHEFNLLTMNQAESIPNEVEHKDLKGRVDLRDVPFVTIDGEDARDFRRCRVLHTLERHERRLAFAGCDRRCQPLRVARHTD